MRLFMPDAGFNGGNNGGVTGVVGEGRCFDWVAFRRGWIVMRLPFFLHFT